MDFKKIISDNIFGDILINEYLGLHTWYKIGGPCDLFIYPKTNDDLVNLITLCNAYKKEFFIIGDGANILVSDAGYRGVVISLQRYFNRIKIEKTSVKAGAGVVMSDLILQCEDKGLKGFEYLSGIPGTLGGLLSMNAGTDNSVISDMLQSIEIIDEHGERRILKKEEISFGYRSAPQLENVIIVSAIFELVVSDPVYLKNVRVELIKKRKEKQPLQYPSCGSVFKRPKNNYAGKLIEDAGMKGYQIGGVKVSEKHAGFFVNIGNATAEDVINLIITTRNTIKEKYGISLQSEVKFLGFSDKQLSDIR